MTTQQKNGGCYSPSCEILYATQSGRAKACARRCTRIVREGTMFQPCHATGCAFDQAVMMRGGSLACSSSSNTNTRDVGVSIQPLLAFCDEIRSSQRLLILFVSTTGDGEATDTIQETWKLLRLKSLNGDLFAGISFCIFCLGDRAYGPQFCAAGRKLAIRLRQLGATLLCPPGYGDDGTPNGGVFADLDIWIEDQLLPCLRQRGSTAGDPRGGISLQQLQEGLISTAPSHDYPYRIKALGKSVHALPDQLDVQHADAYSRFFDHVRPFSAYAYSFSQRGTFERQTATGTLETLVATVVQNERITAPDWIQDTRQIQLEVTHVLGTNQSSAAGIGDTTAQRETLATSDAASWSLDKLPYLAGDVAAIMPCNDPAEVDRFLQVLPRRFREMADHELEIEYLATMESTVGVCFAHWPARCTFRGWLTYCADIHALPEREDLRMLSLFCCPDTHPRGQDQRDKLITLSETSGAALYGDFVLREKRSWAEVMYDFDSLQSSTTLTLEALLAMLSPMRPREFSIASSPSEQWFRSNANDNEHLTECRQSPAFRLELCVAVVEGITPLKRSYHGLCSKYLASLSAGSGEGFSTVRLWIRPGSFQKLPLRCSDGAFVDPVLCIGAGTGIAPLKGLLLEREAIRRYVSSDQQSGERPDSPRQTAVEKLDCDNLLVFGCRKKSADFYYQQLWRSLENQRRLGLLVACSQDQWHKIYVQQVIERADKETKFIYNHLVEKKGAVYIAGGPKMARAVKDTITEILVKGFAGEENPAKQVNYLLSKLQQVGRLRIEAWS